MSAGNASTFEVIPAIDLRGGRVVRLEQGDFDRETTFARDPADQATRFVAAGTRWVHVVDLDGAKDGARRQPDAIARIVQAVAGRAAVQVAGGLRDMDSLDDALGAGAARAVLGTAAITQPTFVAAAIARHGPDRVAVALDVRDGRAVGGGWLHDAPAADLDRVLDQVVATGVRTLIVTAIARDGLLGGPDRELLEHCRERGDASVIASGGIASLADLESVRAIGCGGAIVGRAIYDGRIDLVEAIRTLDAAATD